MNTVNALPEGLTLTMGIFFAVLLLLAFYWALRFFGEGIQVLYNLSRWKLAGLFSILLLIYFGIIALYSVVLSQLFAPFMAWF